MKKVVLTVLIFAAFACCISFNAVSMKKNKYSAQTDTKEGISVIEKLEKQSVKKVQKSIDKTEQKRLAEKAAAEKQASAEESIKKIESGEKSFLQVFGDVYIAGDSLMHGLSEYSIINSSHLITQVSASLSHLNENFSKIVGLNPKILILHYGLNMCSSSSGAGERFVNQYASIIEKLKQSLPNTRIIISLIFPIQNPASTTVTSEEIEEYNKLLVEMCKNENVEYLDSSSVLNAHPECYEPDGIHQNKNFYIYWLKFVMSEMGIY